MCLSLLMVSFLNSMKINVQKSKKLISLVDIDYVRKSLFFLLFDSTSLTLNPVRFCGITFWLELDEKLKSILGFIIKKQKNVVLLCSAY